jgi:hypothetical protein
MNNHQSFNILSSIFDNLSLSEKTLELDTDIENITQVMENMSLITSQEFSIKESTYEKFKVEKYIPLEVSNAFCHKYFDDEDFVYIKLQLPQKILDFIAHHSNGDILDYFSSISNDTTNREEFDNSDIYYNIVSVYQYAINYYQNEHLSPINRIKVFPLGYFKWVSHIVYILKRELRFTPDTLNTFYEMSKVDQELSYGLNLITAQLQIIMHFYEYNGCNIYQLTEHHIQRFIRLVNNLCVIMIHLKFCATHFNANKQLMENPDFIQEDE